MAAVQLQRAKASPWWPGLGNVHARGHLELQGRGCTAAQERGRRRLRFMVARHVGLLQVQTRGEGVVLGLAMEGSSATRGSAGSSEGRQGRMAALTIWARGRGARCGGRARQANVEVMLCSTAASIVGVRAAAWRRFPVVAPPSPLLLPLLCFSHHLAAAAKRGNSPRGL